MWDGPAYNKPIFWIFIDKKLNIKFYTGDIKKNYNEIIIYDIISLTCFKIGC